MKLFVVCFCLLFSSIILLQSEAYIAINIDPEDLERVSEFFHSIILSEQAQTIMPRERHVIRMMLKKTIFGVIQLFGVMMSLVGATIISSTLLQDLPALQPNQMQQPQQPPQQPPQKPQHPQHSQQPQQLQQPKIDVLNCNNNNMDYGCNRNICWKSCFAKDDHGKNLWCYTAPKLRQFHQCNSSSNCSLCWDCIEACHE